MFEFVLRKANQKDIKKIFDLSNDSVVRANSINTKKIEWDEHVRWFNKVVFSREVKFYIAETKDGNFIGQIRFNKNENDCWLVSISLLASFRGKGYAKQILQRAINNEVEIHNFIAIVKKDNKASIKLFEETGFMQMNKNDENLLKFSRNV